MVELDMRGLEKRRLASAVEGKEGILGGLVRDDEPGTETGVLV